MNKNVGILGLGRFLPPQVRRNDWWPSSVTAGWVATGARRGGARPPATPAEAMILEAMAAQRADPFQGAVQRHVMPEGMSSSEMEVEAAKMALASCGRSPQEIDVVLTHTAVAEELLSNTACVLHDALGLPSSCLSMQVEASAYSFLGQLAIAEAFVASGQARCVLLVQSCAASRLLEQQSPISPLFGDGATAVVVGAVGAGRGILGSSHRTDGRWARSLVASVPGQRWYDVGRPILHIADPMMAQEVFLTTVDRGKEVVGEALSRAGVKAAEVDFFGVHQGTPWLARIARHCFGLSSATMVESFAQTGYLFAASIPLGLCEAHLQGSLAPDSLVLLFGGGTGMTYGATLLRWGTA